MRKTLFYFLRSSRAMYTHVTQLCGKNKTVSFFLSVYSNFYFLLLLFFILLFFIFYFFLNFKFFCFILYMGFLYHYDTFKFRQYVKYLNACNGDYLFMINFNVRSYLYETVLLKSRKKIFT